MPFSRNLGSFMVKERAQFFNKFESKWYPISSDLKCLPGLWKVARGSSYPYPLLFSHSSFVPSTAGEKFEHASLLRKFHSEYQVKLSCCQDNTLTVESVITIFPGLWTLYSHETNWTKYPGEQYRWFLLNMESTDCEADLMLDKLRLK